MVTTEPVMEDAGRVVVLDPPPFRRRRWALVAVAVAVVAVAVATWLLTRGGGADDRILVVDGDGAVSLLDPATGDALYTVPGATATPDRTALLTTESAGDQTELRSHDPETGQVTGTTRLDGHLTVRTVSPQGGAVALMPGQAGAGIYEPEPRERTNLTVSYLDERPPRTYELPGNIEPEMFSYDESGLYVLEFDPPTEPDSYFVRRLDLATGEMVDSGAPGVDLNPRMRGRARAQVLHPEGTSLYTLYTLPAEGAPDSNGGPDGAHHDAFIHVIDLVGEESYCIFLDPPIGSMDEAAVGMGISPDGREVFVADPSTSTIARVDTGRLQVAQVARVEQLRHEQAKAAVAVARDGTVFAASGSRVLELDAATLQATFAWSASTTPVSGLSVAASGDQVRVAGGGSVALVDRATRRETAVLEAPARGTVTLLGPPRGSVTEFPLECAC